MLKQLKEKLNIKWWEYIPVIGTMIYAIRVEFFLNRQGSMVRKNVKWFKNIIIGTISTISIIIIILFFLLRNKHGFGSFPWFFWIGVSLGILNNITPYWLKYLYSKGISRWQLKVAKEGHEHHDTQSIEVSDEYK